MMNITIENINQVEFKEHIRKLKPAARLEGGLKYCTKCDTVKTIEEFHNKAGRPDGLTQWCKECNNNDRKKHHHIARRKDPRKEMLNNAKRRAKDFDVSFDLTIDDIPEVPTLCPVLRIPLVVNDRVSKANSASLDRIIPHYGYIPGNVIIVSKAFNSIKKDKTVWELLDTPNVDSMAFLEGYFGNRKEDIRKYILPLLARTLAEVLVDPKRIISQDERLAIREALIEYIETLEEQRT